MIEFGKKTLIMGILNVTPDSFYDGGRYFSADKAYDHAARIISDGADIIDIGGESTRPGSLPVSVEEELERVVPVVERIAKNFETIISVDTTKSSVAEESLKCGATIINDISGLTFDERLVKVVAEHGSYLVIMHIKGKPADMQINPEYDDIVSEVTGFLLSQRGFAVENGVDSKKIILDPGIGFGKSLEDNYVILKNVHKFKELGDPLLIALSRKSLIGKLYENDEDRLPATVALNAIAANGGADIIRVHDVKEHLLAMKAVDMLKRV